MNKNIEVLINKVIESEELQAQFSALDSPDAAYELAKGIQGGFSKEEFVEAMAALSTAEDGCITDEELAATAGGEFLDDGDLPESIKQSIDILGKIDDDAVDVSKSIAKSATVVSNSIAKSATEVSKSVSKSVSKISKALAV